jgi:hypothetical protein
MHQYIKKGPRFPFYPQPFCLFEVSRVYQSQRQAHGYLCPPHHHQEEIPEKTAVIIGFTVFAFDSTRVTICRAMKICQDFFNNPERSSRPARLELSPDAMGAPDTG